MPGRWLGILLLPILVALLLVMEPTLGAGQLRAAPALAARGSVQVAFVPWDDAEAMIMDAIGGARRQILVQAYSFTSRNLAAALIAATRRGVEVLILADREQTFSGDSTRIPELAAAGIAVSLEVRYQSAHNKIMVLDADSPEAAVITGSYNWTYAAQNRNSENVVIFRRHPELARLYQANWRRHEEEALPYDQVRH